MGPVNYVRNLVGLPSVPWLTSKNVAMLSLIIVSSWKQLGYTTLLLLGGMTSIDQSLYEVSYLNGATSWQRFRYVTFPLLSPTILFVMITEVIFSFQIFASSHHDQGRPRREQRAPSGITSIPTPFQAL